MAKCSDWLKIIVTKKKIEKEVRIFKLKNASNLTLNNISNDSCIYLCHREKVTVARKNMSFIIFVIYSKTGEATFLNLKITQKYRAIKVSTFMT